MEADKNASRHCAPVVTTSKTYLERECRGDVPLLRRALLTNNAQSIVLIQHDSQEIK